MVHSHGMKAGLAISPHTPASVVTDDLGNAADLLLVMTVVPGKGGQKFMPECLEKVKELRARFPSKNIQVDGGVGSGNACQCARAGECGCGMSIVLKDRFECPGCWNSYLWGEGSKDDDLRDADSRRWGSGRPMKQAYFSDSWPAAALIFRKSIDTISHPAACR